MEDALRPGKGNAKYRSKQRYFRYSQDENLVFQAKVGHFEINVFENMIGTKMSEFNNLFEPAEREITKQMNVRKQILVQTQHYRETCKRALQLPAMTFNFSSFSEREWK